MEPVLREVRLLGAAGREFTRSIWLAVESPAEAIRALSALFPTFKGWVLAQHDRGVAWRVITDAPIGEDELTRSTGSERIIFAPLIHGAGGAVKAVVGVVLIVASFFMPAVFLGISSLSWGLLGGSLLLSGVAQMLPPTPKPASVAADREADLQSNLFSRNQGTDGQGECVPLLYGRRLVQSPRLINFSLQNLPDPREVYTGGTIGLSGYVNRTWLY